MSSVTRTPLCTVKVCPFPTDPWAHVCAVCEAPAVHHHHREPKGMGGSKARDIKENITMLCPKHHQEAHGIGASSATVEVPNSGGNGADASTVAPAASASTGEGEASMVSADRSARHETLPSPAGASRGLPEGRVGRDERGNNPAGQTVQGLPPGSLASGLGATHG